MSEIDPLIAEILLKGDDEFLEKLTKVGEEVSEKWEKLNSAFEKTGNALEALTSVTALAVAAFTAVTAAVVAFTEEQLELSQKTLLLAEAFGTTGEQLQQLEQIFAASGVKVEQFERLANRLTITIAREWPSIAASIRTYADENDAAMLRVSEAGLRVQDAQNKVVDNAAARASTMAKSNDEIEASYLKLQFAAQHAASEQLGALQAVNGAQLSVTAATQHLAELEGRPPSSAEKENLAIAQAQQAVDTARRAEADARIAQQEKAANAALKQRQMEQAYADLSRKAAQDARDDAAQSIKDKNAVTSAIIAQGDAEEKLHRFQLTNAVSIRAALDGVVSGSKAAATSIDLAEVSVQNLTKGIIAQAAETSKSVPPTGWEALRAAARLFNSELGKNISQTQQLAIVNHLAATSMQSMGGAGAELLNAMKKNSGEFERLAKYVKDHQGALDDDAKKIEDFKGALSSMNLTVSQLSQQFAAFVSPAFTAFLTAANDLFLAIQSSATETGGTLHEFGLGLETVGQLIKGLVITAGQMIQKFLEMFSLDGPTGFKLAVIAIVTVLGLLAGPWVAIPLLIAEVITTLGGLQEVVHKVYEAMKDNAVTRFWERLVNLIERAGKALGLLKPGASATAPHGQADNSNGQDDPQGVSTRGFASGGHITGPGTGTSDSIMARLSNGEFVVKAAAVSAYGAGLFHALNNMTIPGFASGGLVAAPVRMGGGAVTPATSVVNLSIDGRSFNGLRGPKSTVDDLSSFAVARQTSASGSNPSWMR